VNDAANLNPEWKRQFRSDDIKQWLPKTGAPEFGEKKAGVDLNLRKRGKALLGWKPVVVRRIGTDQSGWSASRMSPERRAPTGARSTDEDGRACMFDHGQAGWLESDALR
jgi:hypothetical protein